jgi:hypothetical protein
MAATSGASLWASAEQYAGHVSYKFTAADWHRFLRSAAAVATSDASRLPARQQVAVDDAYRHQATREFRGLSVGQIVRSLPKRLAYLWGTADSPPVGYRIAHRIGQAQYAILVALVIAGLVLRRRRLLAEWPLWITAIYLTCLHLVFHVEGRYTLPARPLLLIYAAAGAVAAYRWALHRRQVSLAPEII